jgi:EAL domain-containing protein (putative c-di-GMP-specific phosphodiesterase class I)
VADAFSAGRAVGNLERDSPTPLLSEARTIMSIVATPDAAVLPEFDRFLATSELHPAYQPIVDLTNGDIVGFEALARWPDLAGATPDVVFAAGAACGRIRELDWACRLAALDDALAFGLGRRHVLFVNVEPETLGQAAPSNAALTVAAAQTDLRVMIELTERSLASHPAELLRVVDWARTNGWGIALDDVGAEPASLALLPFLAPDVIKLDITLVTQRPNSDQAAIMAAVMAHSERTGAVILAEGVETQAHLDQALALGATLGQGWLFGRPAPLVKAATPRGEIAFARPSGAAFDTPFALVSRNGRLRVGRKGLLLDLCRHIEQRGMAITPAPVVLAAFQTADRFTSATAVRFAQLATRCPLVAALGVDLSAESATTSAPGVLGNSLSAADPLAEEWTVTVIGPHYAAALIARDMDDDGPDLDRRFQFVVTHDRDLVLGAARSLMARITTPEIP